MSFQKLSFETLHEILPLLESRLPSTTMMFNIVKLTLSGKYPVNDRIEIYGYNNAINADCLFIDAIMKPKNQNKLSVIYAPELVTDDMLQAFAKLYNWTEPLVFGAVMAPFASYLEKVGVENGCIVSKGPAADMFLPIEKALTLNLNRDFLNDEFELKELSVENASKVCQYWKYGTNEEENVAEAIQAFGAVGIFKTKSGTEGSLSNDRNNDDLVSWVVHLRVGTINALHTVDEHRRRGLGQLAIEAASKAIAEEGIIPLCEIEPYNEQSRALMDKVGFQFVHDVYWMFTKPSNCSNQD